MSELKVVGTRAPRVDGLAKVTGKAKFAADYSLPGMLHGKFLRSPYPHAKILNVDTSDAEKAPGVKAIITAADEPAGRRLFASDKAYYRGQKIAAVAAEDPWAAEEAVKMIKVKYEPLPAVTDMMEAMKPDAPRIREEEPKETKVGKLYNIAGVYEVEHGDVEKGFQEADIISEDEFSVPWVHQMYMEPHCALVDIDACGKLIVWTSSQGHFAIRQGIANVLGIPLTKINVIGTTMGGAFGAKFALIVHPHAVMLAQKANRPVKVVINRMEEFLDSNPGPGCTIKLKTGVKKDGTLTAREAESYWDTGAVSGASIGQTMRIRGIYRIPAVRVNAYSVYTNKCGPGAYRAPGSPQSTYASEAQLDIVARKLGMDPIEFRLKNMLDEGESPIGGGPMHRIAFKETLQAAAERADWKNRAKEKNRGWGVAVGEWTNGAGPCGAYCSIHEDGSVRVFSGLMDITGTDTIMAQIAAEVLCVPFESVSVTRGDTDSAPYASGSGGSLAAYSFGNAVKRAAEDAKRKVMEIAPTVFKSVAEIDVTPEDLDLKEGKVVVKNDEEKSITLGEAAMAALSNVGGPIVGKGAFAREPSSCALAAQIAQVEVDPETGKVSVLKFVGAQDVGTALNPNAVEGQIEGGATQGMSWSLVEQMQFDNERGMANPTLMDYHIPTAADLPMLESVLVETAKTEHGPYGAKGVGEPPITPTLATIANAVRDATGVRISKLPLTPERVAMALKGNG